MTSVVVAMLAEVLSVEQTASA